MKALKIILFVLLAAASMSICCFGEELALPEDEWEGLCEALPPEVADKLPDGALDGSDVAESVARMSSGEYVMAVISDALGVGLGESAELLLLLLSALAAIAVMENLGQSFEDTGYGFALRVCSTAILASVVLYSVYTNFERLGELFEKLWIMLGAMIPVSTGIWAMGGNLSTAASGGAWLYVMLGVCQSVVAGSVLGVSGMLCVLCICDAASEEVSLGRMMSAIKKIYNFFLGFVMTMLLSFLASQTTLAASADTVAARSARLMSGTLIPVVGSSVGETFRTLAAGVSYLKNVFGIGGIVMIALLTLPLAITLLLTRFVFLICSGVADMLGCRSGAKLLEGIGDVYGTMLGALSVVSVSFVLGLCIFMRTVVAVA